MVPTSLDVAGWIGEAGDQGARTVRTGALFPEAVPAFLDAGFEVVDTLTLLSCPIAAVHRTSPAPTGRHPHSRRPEDQLRMRRLRTPMMRDAAEIDRRSFAAPWANDAAALTDIMTATPYHRSRSVHHGRRMVGFSISGRANRSGYVQRLAVDPSVRRRGIARLLLDDALHWMGRRGVERVMVNTASDNHRALALYESSGFERVPGSLLILEREVR
jgi:ribosomal protein S18 acetylase RimI-like enzyme